MAQTIMIIDDEKRLVSLVESYLKQEGYHVLTAGDGREALSIARKESPDLILLDIMMPEMDGYEFMETYRKYHRTPIILLTARVEEQDHVIGLDLGADDYVTKPFRPRELMARVRSVLRLTPSEFDLLAALMSAPGHVFSRLDLLDIIQGIRYEGYQRTIDLHIKNLRAKIEKDPRSPHYIETVYGVGYRFARE
ncbi:MAG: response regulator transcription factor [Chloroflexi bacterium]|nr:response regulator transcription factor [Chloroflexota bacterium]